jgi:TRAP-type transport system periplasmic protein
MKKCMVISLVLIMMCSLVFGAGAKESPEEIASVFTLKISTAATANQTHAKALQKFKEVLEASTDRIKVEVYDSSTLFKQDANITAMIKGNLEMCYTDASWLVEFMPSLSMFTAPYLYKDYKHMDTVLNGQIGADLFDRIAKELGVRPLGAYYLGSRTINLRTDKEVKSRDDLKGIQLRMPNSESWLYMGRALGATPVAMGFNDTYLALQTGAVDGQDNPLPGTMDAKFNEVTKSITLTNHVIGTVWLAIAESVWNKLGQDLQGKVMEAVEASRDWNDMENIAYESQLADQFRALGLNVYAPDMTAYKNEVFNVYLSDPKMSGSWDMGLYDQIMSVMK